MGSLLGETEVTELAVSLIVFDESCVSTYCLLGQVLHPSIATNVCAPYCAISRVSESVGNVSSRCLSDVLPSLLTVSCLVLGLVPRSALLSPACLSLTALSVHKSVPRFIHA